MEYLYTNLLGSFVFDDKFSIIKEKRFKTAIDFLDKDKVEKELLKKFPKAEIAKKEALRSILAQFNDKKYSEELELDIK